MSQPEENKPTARSAITHSSGMPRLLESVSRSVSPRSRRGAGAAGARGGGGCTRARWIAALAGQAQEFQAAIGGGDVDGGWRRPWPITDLTAPPQCPPPRSSRLGGGGDRRRPASLAQRAAAALGLQLPTGLAAGPGSERGQRARPENPPTSVVTFSTIFWVSMRTITLHKAWVLGRTHAWVPWEGSAAGLEDTPPPLPLQDPTRRAETMPGRYSPAATGSALRCESDDSAPAKTQSDAFEVGARRDSRMERAGSMAMGKCNHVKGGRPLWATYVRILPVFSRQPAFTLMPR